MNVALAGMGQRDVAMLGMFVSKSLPGWRCTGVAGRKGDALPPADLYVVDLAGAGLARWSEDAEADLLKLVGGGPAVLLTPAFDSSWNSLDDQVRKKKSIVLLQKPYGTEDMRSALQKAHAGRLASAVADKSTSWTGRRATPVPPQPVSPPPAPGIAPFVRPAAHAPRPQAVFASTALGSRASVPKAPAASAPAVDLPAGGEGAGGEFTAGQLRERLLALPRARRPVFLQMLSQALEDQRPFELRVTVNNAVIVDPHERWVASNTPMLVMDRLCRSDTLASVVSLRVIEDEDPLVRAQRLGMSMQPLESFLWEVAHGVLELGV